jgi:hypothetical protein
MAPMHGNIDSQLQTFRSTSHANEQSGKPISPLTKISLTGWVNRVAPLKKHMKLNQQTHGHRKLFELAWWLNRLTP